PERRNGAHHLAALGLVASKWEQQRDAEIKAVEDDVEHHGGADDAGPDEGQPELDHGARSAIASRPASWAAAIGRLATPSRGAAAARPASPIWMSRLMK